ncbi:hypothetical protein [Niabella ginsengisoli]|uniref:Uncharacterized protein n=1 Tax=Niabella ginsengisoli TaxID=522298 RepID=A0ABS9SQ00_9BACT|nr:hypothetical protein [Niabella ginsengisoli]MCH5600451.1 hypothetical protein [Niabella ginsengisoli]
MKKLGLVGGISWVSTTDYYRYINEGVNKKLGGLNYAECLIYSVNFQNIHNNNLADDWDATFEILRNACDSLKKQERKPFYFAPIRCICWQTK